MPMYSGSARGWTPAAFTQNQAVTNDNFHAIATTSASNAARIIEVFIGGEATSSTVNEMALRRHSTHSTNATADGTKLFSTVPMFLSPFSAAATSKTFNRATTTNPTLANLSPVHYMSFNSFGGVIRWVAAPGEEIWIQSATANNDEVSITSSSGVGIVGTTFVWEEL